MQITKPIVKLLLGVMLVGQFGSVGVAMAAQDEPSSTPTPTVSSEPTPTPSASTEPSATPSAEPSMSPSQSPQSSTTPSPSASAGSLDSRSNNHEDKPKDTGVSYSKTGVDGCVGIVPKWVFDTTSGTWASADQGSFTCDKKTGYYLSPKYVFDKETGWYQILAANAPMTENMITAPNVVHTTLGDLVVGSKDYLVAQQLGLLNANGGIASADGVGGAAGAATQVGTTTNNQSWLDLTNLVNVINTLQSNATSGDVSASKNTSVGDLNSGTASVIANLINLLASAWSWSNGNLNFFMQSIGNYNKDITLTPTDSATAGGGQLGSANNTTQGDSANNSSLNVNAKDSGNLVNNVDLNATSGNVSATKNTGVGNVASGGANAEVNIINLINSFISSGSSFFGILNIMGNLNGDILFPTGFLDGLLASNSAGPAAAAAGPGSTAGVDSSNSLNATSNNAAYTGVDNNINTSAASGSVNADANTSAGNATSGSASTANSLFNLANSTVFGDNAVLVIVNVLGHWVGKIMTLPGGSTTSALLTGNAQVGANAPDSSSQLSTTNNADANVNQSSTGNITNNVNVKAQSGDAEATKNTEVGNVSTGDASAASNVANIFNSVLNVKHWFGVLVINVFGDWFGSVNDNTAAGEESVNKTLAAQSTAAVQATPSSLPKVGLLALAGSAGSAVAARTAAVAAATPAPSSSPQVLTAAAHQQTGAQLAAQAQGRDMSLLFAISAVIMLIAGALATIDSKLKRSQN